MGETDLDKDAEFLHAAHAARQHGASRNLRHRRRRRGLRSCLDCAQADVDPAGTGNYERSGHRVRTHDRMFCPSQALKGKTKGGAPARRTLALRVPEALLNGDSCGRIVAFTAILKRLGAGSAAAATTVVHEAVAVGSSARIKGYAEPAALLLRALSEGQRRARYLKRLGQSSEGSLQCASARLGSHQCIAGDRWRFDPRTDRLPQAQKVQ